MDICKLRLKSDLVFAKALIFILRNIIRTNATSLPGKIMLKIRPNILTQIGGLCKKHTITVTGTNGKTTTSGLIANILSLADNEVVHNAEGANMLTGVLTAALNKLPLSGQADYFVFESDEAYLSKLYDYISADSLVVTNLFRDQLDRYGELATTADKIKKAILKNPNLKVILNADDPMLYTLGTDRQTVFFGFDEIEFTNDCASSTSPAETATCTCGKDFEYTKSFYSHVGHWGCKCGISRPKPKYRAIAKIGKEYTEIKVNDTYTFKVYIPNIYNAYNALAAIAATLEEGIDAKTIQAALDGYKPAFGRAEHKIINGKKVFVQLIKNPTGATEVLRTINAYKENSVLFIAINDNYADGRDVSWLWDSDFEILRDYPNKIIISGIRALDMALRLKYAGVNKDKMIIEKNLKKSFNLALDMTDKDSQLLVMPTYTALLELDKM